MKKIFTVLFVFISIEYTGAQSTCVIDGNIRNPRRNFIVFYYGDNYWLKSYTDTIKLDKNNNFRYTYKFSLPFKEAFLKIDNKTSLNVWCSDKEQLKVNIPDSVSPPVFSGSLARIHKYMQEDLLFWKKIYNDYQKRNPEFGKQSFNFINEYFLIQDSITNDRFNFLKVFFADKPSLLERTYSEQHKADFIYNDLYYKLAYNNPAMEKFKVYQTLCNVSSPVTYQFSDVNFNNEKLLHNKYFLNFASSFFIKTALKKKKSDWKKDEIYNEVYNIIDNTSQNGFCKSMLKAEFINEEINKLRVFRFSEGVTEQTYRKYVDLLKQNEIIENQVAQIEENLNKTISELNKITKGSPAPSCQLTDSIGKSITLEYLKGKIIYIDVWASWCGPCIATLPEWNKLVDQYRNNSEIVFVLLSIDSSKEEWLKAMKKYNPQGLNYISMGNFKSEFSKKFNINAIPSNVIIDKMGKIIAISTQLKSIDLVSKLLEENLK